jgi:hypothetical protein
MTEFDSKFTKFMESVSGLKDKNGMNIKIGDPVKIQDLAGVHIVKEIGDTSIVLQKNLQEIDGTQETTTISRGDFSARASRATSA